MKYGRLETGQRVSADDASKVNRHFCPGCGAPLILKQGEINDWHFAHESGSECDAFTENKMSEWHIRHQSEFPENCREVRLEKDGIVHIADVMFGNLIIEFQHSPMKNEVFEERCDFYTQFGNLLWVFDRTDQFMDENIVWIQKKVDKDYGYYKWKYSDKMLGKYDFKKSKVFLFIELGLTGHGCLVDWNPDGMKYFNGRRMDRIQFSLFVKQASEMSFEIPERPVLYKNEALERIERSEAAQKKLDLLIPKLASLTADRLWGISFVERVTEDLRKAQDECRRLRMDIYE